MLIGVAALMFFARYVRTGLLSRVLAVAVFVGFIELFPWIEATARNGFGL
jgi:PTS system mannose-specific IID component